MSERYSPWTLKFSDTLCRNTSVENDEGKSMVEA